MNTLPKQDAATPHEDSTTRLIPLTKGQFAIVDAADYDWLNQWKWQAVRGVNSFYAHRKKRISRGIRISAVMHREIVQPPTGKEVDHIDGDGLNNRRSNLRIATISENMRNRRIFPNNTSGHKGVSWNSGVKKWVARITINRKLISLGYFSNKEQAALAYQAAARKFHGEFARLK